jgi:hypothetical protein
MAMTAAGVTVQVKEGLPERISVGMKEAMLPGWASSVV